MNLILHQFKTDCRHFRFWLSAWWASLVLAVVMLRWFGSHGLSGELFTLITFFQILLGIFLIARLVQSDPMMETSAFWLTRPIRRFHLACSKTAFLGLFLLAPYLLMLSAGWLWCAGFSVILWLKALAEYGLMTGAILLAVATVAALTKNFRQFLLMCVLGVVAFLLWIGMLMTMERMGWLKDPHSSIIPKNNKFILMWLVLAAGMLSAWVLQAFTARRNWCVAIFALALASTVPIGNYWKGKAIFIHEAPLPLVTVSLTVLADGDSLEDTAGSQVLWSHFRVNGLAENQLAGVHGMQGTFRQDNKKRTDVSMWAPEWGRWTLDNHEADVFHLVRNNFPSNTLWFGTLQTRRNPTLPLAPKNHAPAKGATGHFSGSMQISIYDLEKLADLPLKNGSSRVVMPGRRLDIVSVSSSTDNIHVKLANTVPDLLFNPENVYDAPLFRNDCIYVLYHPDFGEAYPKTSNNGYNSSSGLGFGTEGSRVDLDFPFPALRARLTGITAQEWLSHARLLVFETIKSGVAATPDKKTWLNGAYLGFDQPDYVFKQWRTSDSPTGGQAAGLAAIRELTLPSHPDSVRIGSYIKTIADNIPSDLNQAAIEMINKKMDAIGSNGVSVVARMLPFEEPFENVVVEPFLFKYSTRDDLPELLKALPRDLNLASFFRSKQWTDEAQVVIVSLLPDHRLVFTDDALLLAAEARDPKTYAELSWHFVHAKFHSLSVFDALQKCPGFDLDNAMRQAWKMARVGLGSDYPLSIAAAEQGLPEALNISLRRVASGASQSAVQRLEQLTSYHGPDAEFAAWVNQHIGQFQYLPSERRYALAQ